GTESINLALKGVAEMYREKGSHIVTTVIEQRAGLDVAKRLERQGSEVTYVPVQPDGLIDVEQIGKAITDKTVLVSVMFANNEIGTIQDRAATSGACGRARCPCRSSSASARRPRSPARPCARRACGWRGCATSCRTPSCRMSTRPS